jgi:hypothetical protein
MPATASTVPPLSETREQLRRARVIDHLEGVERRMGEMGHGAGEPSQEDQAIIVGDRRGFGGLAAWLTRPAR